MALSNANPQRLSGPNTTSNFVRADDLEQKVVSKLEVDTLQSEKQSVNRWPTLFEILNRRTQPPVDLWSFYVYMRDEQRNIDYLDFWIDTVQHMGLCKAYVKGLKQSLAVNERIRNADQTFNSAPGQSTHLGQQTSPSNRQSNTSSRDSKSSSLLLDLLMRSNLLEESDSRRMSAFLRGETSVRSSDPLVNAKIDELKRKSQTPSDDNSKDASSESNSAKRVSTINPQMIETMIQQDLLPREKSLKDSHIATREKLSQSAQNIVDTYFLDSSPKRIVIPPEMVERLIQAVQRDGRDDPEVFDESREFVFKAMEHEAYPNFLRYHALSNVTSKSAAYRMLGSFFSGLGAFWTGYTLIFLDYQPKQMRWVVVVPFFFAFYLLLSSYYRVDPLLYFAGYSESYASKNGLVCIKEPFVKNLLKRRSLFVLLLILLMTAVLSIIFALVPGRRL
ncbi:hypothetical protein KL905_002466 [Ogataea polymorpha]|nr:hypothetical protein KL907_002210 [Ogataea polymorpha]KAG7909817.1 hypothetical protein KL906_001722 [Ogataea polymorpha]KAG7921701.1 hypothetical protein KL905_002466 [Ogataea polymorpha]KAG7927125.1 hypothetical protein KL925_002496 [Ogataea polymorpha]